MQDYGGLEGCFPRIFLEIRCSEIASGAIFGQKQSRSSYYIFHPMLGSPIRILLSQLTSNFHKRRLRLAEK